jgi:phage gp46-like protein
MPDVKLFHRADGGEIEIRAGQPVMSDGLETAVYLSLFGGNERDSGGEDTQHLEWWGNKSERDPARRYRSETQHLIRSLPLVPRNLRRIEDAVHRDLAWLIPNTASRIVCAVSIPALDTVRIRIDIEIKGQVLTFEFTESGSTNG